MQFEDDVLHLSRRPPAGTARLLRLYRQPAAGEQPAQTTVLRRSLQRLSVRISAHPYWASVPGRAPAARMALKQATWERGNPTP
jgi:hypothetical protein